MGILAVAASTAGQVAPLLAEEAEGAGLTINLFWIAIAAVNFIVFAVIAWYAGFKGLARNLAARRARIDEGLRDADAARRDREAASDQRQAVLAEARREANEIVARAQRLADEGREQSVAATRVEVERLRTQAAAEIDAERQRAMSDVRSQVADLALLAAGKVVGETMSGERERRLVEEFLTTVTAPSGGRG